MSARTVGLTSKIAAAANRAPAAERERVLANPGFGRVFSEHMAIASWNRGRGWHDATVRPYGPIPMDPGTSVLHYAQAGFEGLNAHRQHDGAIASLRPRANADPFRRSAPKLPPSDLPPATLRQAIGL